MSIRTFGSLCSGIEAASYVFEPLGIQPLWLSEIADFQSRFLAEKYPDVPNLGDMNDIPQMIDNGEVEAPDMLCGGTPCQAFSLAGWRNGINDDRGQLTLKYIDIVNSIDAKRLANGQNRTVFFWENVEGALTDKTNAFGCFLAGLIGLEEPIISPLGKIKKTKSKEGEESAIYPKWPNAGVVYGKERNIAWRILDAKYFGLPQQRRRIYVLGGGKDFQPEKVLFEEGSLVADPFKPQPKKAQPSLFDEPEDTTDTTFELTKIVNGHKVEAFRSYSDCLYAAYGTKWNGNAAAFNGSLYFAQDGRLRRLDPLECERLMGFPDNYTLLDKCKDTQRYQAVGNSWAVPVIKWIAERLKDIPQSTISFHNPTLKIEGASIFLLDDFNRHIGGRYINASKMPYDYRLANMVDIVDTDCPEKFYITDKGCTGILRRKYEHNAGMNTRLEAVLKDCSDKEELKRLGIDI
jgi:DNA (cytosine-5)-methyltransferase 1